MPLAESGVREHLRGVAAGPLTPFDDDLDIEHDELAANATTLYGGGVCTLLASTNISEYHLLTRQERVDVAATAVDTLPSDVCVPTGVGESTANVRELIDAYDRIGVDGMMMTPPDHTYVHERDLLRYYEKLAETLTALLVLYVRGFNPSVNYLRDLAGLGGVVGIKHAIENTVKLGAAASTTDDDVVWVDGLVEPFAVSFWNEGIKGFSAGVSNFRPEVDPAPFEAFTEENWGRVRELRNICLPHQNLRDQTGQNNSLGGATSVSVVKKGLELTGLRGRAAREPIRSLSVDDKRRAEELYDQLDDDIERLID